MSRAGFWEEFNRKWDAINRSTIIGLTVARILAQVGRDIALWH